MLKTAAVRLLAGVSSSSSSLAASARAACGGSSLFTGVGEWTRPFHTASIGTAPATIVASCCTKAAGAPHNTPPRSPGGLPTAQNPASHTHAYSTSASKQESSSGAASSATQDSPSGPAASSSPHDDVPPSGPSGPGTSSAAGPQSDATHAGAAGAAPPPSGPASRRDKSASADVVYPSSRDDNLGVQRNWFNALFTQLSVMQRTGMAPHLRGRQKEVFEAVEREFEGLWERHVQGKGLEGTAHRGMLLCCLAIATHKVLLYETGDDTLVREVVRTNLGGTAVGIMMRLHKTRLWLLLRLLAEDPYKQAVRFLPSLQGDLGSLVAGRVAEGPGEATWTASGCAFYSVLAAEGATELLPEFCCQFSMQWLEVFSQYGVRVGLEESLGFGDERCVVRITKPMANRSGEMPGNAGGSSSSSS